MAGKSTLLGVCGALDRPSRGSVEVLGRDLARLDASSLAALRRMCVGYVFQELNLWPGLTSVENVMLPLDLDACVPPRRASSPWRPGRALGRRATTSCDRPRVRRTERGKAVADTTIALPPPRFRTEVPR